MQSSSIYDSKWGKLNDKLEKFMEELQNHVTTTEKTIMMIWISNLSPLRRKRDKDTSPKSIPTGGTDEQNGNKRYSQN